MTLDLVWEELPQRESGRGGLQVRRLVAPLLHHWLGHLCWKFISWKPMAQINLSWVGLHIHADLLWHLDAVWLLHQSERRCLNIPIPIFLTYDPRPWHKDGLHPALLPGLEVALLRGDVLHQLPSLVAAHLASKSPVGMVWKEDTLSAIDQRIATNPREVEVSKINRDTIKTFSLLVNTQLDGAHISLGTFLKSSIVWLSLS